MKPVCGGAWEMFDINVSTAIYYVYPEILETVTFPPN
jgi:hypothetical protein